jgi:hypothetical protein
MDQKSRVFSEQEVSEILKRATTLQESSGQGPTYQPGVTRDELLRAAQEMGVSPQFLEQAIKEQLGDTPQPHTSLIPEQERVVDGELDPQNFDLILDGIRHLRGRHGARQVGRSLSAKAFHGSGIARVHVTSRGGRTKINVKSVPVIEALGTFYPAFIISMIAGTNLAASGNNAAAYAVAAVAFLAAFFACRAWMIRSRVNTAKLADKIHDIVADEIERETPSPVSRAQTQTPAEEVRINLGQG